MKYLRLICWVFLTVVVVLSLGLNLWLFRETQRLTDLNARLVDESIAYVKARHAIDVRTDEANAKILALAEKLNLENQALRRQLVPRR